MRNRDGTKLMFERRMRVSKLLMAFSGHSVYRASEELEYLGRARPLCLNTSLKLGNTYFLLPQTQNHMQKKPQPQQQVMKGRGSKVEPMVSGFHSDSEEEELVAVPSPPPQTIKIRMTRQQFAEMLIEGSIRLNGSQQAEELVNKTAPFRRPTVWNSSMKLFNHPKPPSEQHNLLTASDRMKRSWRPELASILEEPTR
ncbi:hypothetical protein R1sor_017382 [Riccia sorocarpa]|uniref:Uncharacterized protein n=1 Tax=Riccia sorocarpa TaxID=122646 RepID=A0ABD3I6P7_9MARC